MKETISKDTKYGATSIVILMSFLFLMWQFNPLTAFVIVCIVTAVVAIIYYFRKKVNKLKRYLNRVENIYILGNHPKTREEVSLVRFEDIVIFVPHKQVHQEKEHQKELLELSRNPRNIQIHTFTYQEPPHVNEDFNTIDHHPSYAIRIEQFIAKDREKHLTQFYEKNPDIFRKYHMGQEVEMGV